MLKAAHNANVLPTMIWIAETVVTFILLGKRVVCVCLCSAGDDGQGGTVPVVEMRFLFCGNEPVSDPIIRRERGR